jgi:hypothetical protein
MYFSPFNGQLLENPSKSSQIPHSRAIFLLQLFKFLLTSLKAKNYHNLIDDPYKDPFKAKQIYDKERIAAIPHK